eukprot:Stramenopile-MAST_4_protein_5085
MDLRTFKMYSVPGMAEPPASLQRGDSLPYLVPPKPERQRSLSPTLSNFDEIKSLIDRNHTEDPSLKYKGQGLTLVVVGASGDLAKKKTYPSLFQLFKLNYLPENVSITGYARSSYTNTSFRDKIRPFLTGKVDDSKVEEFLAKCEYCQGTGYDDLDSWELLQAKLNNLEREQSTFGWNRIFYFAIPPPQFAPSARAIKAKAMTPNGWNRFIVEKPFGKDSESSAKLSTELGTVLAEDQIYRIDHYLGKEMVQNLMVLRFSNIFLSPLWNRDHVKCVIITFKEDFGTEGRGGYFNEFGIIRDVMQNHLLQVLSLVAMEPPVRVTGHDHSNFIRDEKVKVLRCIPPLTLDDVIVGQYIGAKGKPGYLEDDTVPKGSKCPTYALAQFQINNSRWSGVPFIMKAGKALNQRKAEVRIQLKSPPGNTTMFVGEDVPNNELVIRIQPDEAVYMKMNVKMPGFRSRPMISEMDLNYASRFPSLSKDIPDAYTRLILDVLRGQQSAFVRNDELQAAWAIFTPVLHALERSNGPKPVPYEYGSRGPSEADAFLSQIYHRSEEYTYVSA